MRRPPFIVAARCTISRAGDNVHAAVISVAA
jgi:hypothetical protein